MKLNQITIIFIIASIFFTLISCNMNDTDTLIDTSPNNNTTDISYDIYTTDIQETTHEEIPTTTTATVPINKSPKIPTNKVEGNSSANIKNGTSGYNFIFFSNNSFAYINSNNGAFTLDIVENNKITQQYTMKDLGLQGGLCTSLNMLNDKLYFLQYLNDVGTLIEYDFNTQEAYTLYEFVNFESSYVYAGNTFLYTYGNYAYFPDVDLNKTIKNNFGEIDINKGIKGYDGYALYRMDLTTYEIEMVIDKRCILGTVHIDDDYLYGVFDENNAFYKISLSDFSPTLLTNLDSFLSESRIYFTDKYIYYSLYKTINRVSKETGNIEVIINHDESEHKNWLGESVILNAHFFIHDDDTIYFYKGGNGIEKSVLYLYEIEDNKLWLVSDELSDTSHAVTFIFRNRFYILGKSPYSFKLDGTDFKRLS